MTRSMQRLLLGAVVLLLLLVLAGAVVPAATRQPRSGGVLRPLLREDLPQGFSVTWPALPCYSNLVVFDQGKQLERPEGIVSELAERWSWQDSYRNLVFFLRRDVRWHDGQPFTAKDVKFTFDMVREAQEVWLDR
jgi:peptide/nickel transport system substrate-binding protein